MKHISRKSTHEKFHSNTHAHRRLIQQNNFTYRHIVKVLDRYITPGKTVLDIGCGSGTLSLYLAANGNNIEGIDISEKAIEESKQSAKNLHLEDRTGFKVMDFPNVIPGKKYDAILLIEVLEHLPDDALALSKLYSLLKNDGILIITTPSSNAPLHKMGLTKTFDKKVGHLRRYTIEGLRKICEQEGFKVVETYGTEGIVRNFLFLNPIAGKSVRFIKYFVSDLVTFIDNISCKLIGESDIFIILKK